MSNFIIPEDVEIIDRVYRSDQSIDVPFDANDDDDHFEAADHTPEKVKYNVSKDEIDEESFAGLFFDKDYEGLYKLTKNIKVDNVIVSDSPVDYLATTEAGYATIINM